MTGLVHWLGRAGKRSGDLVIRHARMLGDPESMVAALIVTLWSILAAIDGGMWSVLVSLCIGWFLHVTAVETGSHVSLWLTTAALLIMVVLASAITFDGLGPVPLAAAGATVLVHNELVRLNYTRRRRAVIDPEVFRTAPLGAIVAGVLAVIGATLIGVLSDTEDRSWLWMPVATGVLIAIGLALTLLPVRGAPPASRERWQPGERMPPPPTVHREHEL